MQSEETQSQHTPAEASHSARATVSLCMIVRDCADSLRRALNSARPFVDEMIVVDTGSVDETAKVAGDCGARVFHFPWCDDFSKARNYSLEQATGDWIIWIDADDVLPSASGREMLYQIARHPQRDAAFWVHVEQQTVDDRGRRRKTRHGHIKLFPRHPDIRFRYRVHEQITPAIRKVGLPLTMTSMVVQHARDDRTPEQKMRRIERNLRLLELDLADFPDDPVVLMNMAMTTLHVSDGPPRAVEFARRSLEGIAPESSLRLNVYLIQATAHGRLQDRTAELETLRRAQREFPDDAALLLRLGTLLVKLGCREEAQACYRGVIDGAKLRASVLSFADAPARATLELGRLYAQAGQTDEAKNLWQGWLKTHPQDAAIEAELRRL